MGQGNGGQIVVARPERWPVAPDADGEFWPAGEPVSVVRQERLPLPWQLIRAADEFDERDFAHPAELDFARILTFYRIRWSYEPTTFPLAFSDDGRPSEMFTPDFYLPEHRLYIELTTMRQRLVTRKNRKIRRLRELYPQVRVKLLYRRDCDRLIDAYRSVATDLASCRVGRVLFDEERIRRRIDELAATIAIAADIESQATQHRSPRCEFGQRVRPVWYPGRSCQGTGAVAVPASLPTLPAPIGTDGAAPGGAPDPIRPDAGDRATDRRALVVIGVDRGSAVFARHLTAALERRGVAIERARVTLTRHRSPLGARRVRIGQGPHLSVAGRRVLVVADVVSTGLSLAYVTWWLRRRGARSVEICALLDRKSARLVDVPLRYVAFDAPNELVVGFGLHLRRQFRNLPFIASLVAAPTADNKPG